MTGAVAAGALFRVDIAADAETSEIVGLPVLPNGPPSVRTGHALVDGISFPNSLATTDVAFVGTVSGIGGSEVVTPAIPGRRRDVTVHRTRFSVERPLRNASDIDFIDITLFDISNFSDVFRNGERYLVLSEWRELGELRVRHLVPVGYPQGVFRVEDGIRATNKYHGTIDIDVVEGLLK